MAFGSVNVPGALGRELKETDRALEARIASAEKTLSGMEKIPGIGPPTPQITAKVGQIYINVVTGEQWKCVAVNSGGSVWEKLTGSGTALSAADVGAVPIEEKAKPGGVATLDAAGKVPAAQLPASMPASDVYAWAKAPQKPAYTASEVGAAPSGHTHTAAEVGAAAVGHTHTAAEAGAAPASHTHTAAQVGAVPVTGGTVNGELQVNGALHLHRGGTQVLVVDYNGDTSFKFLNGCIQFEGRTPTTPVYLLGIATPEDTAPNHFAANKGYVDNKITAITPSSIGAAAASHIHTAAAVGAKASTWAPFHVGTSAPSDKTQLWIDTTANTGGLKYWNGSAWKHVPVAYT